MVSVATFEALKEKVPDLQIEIIAGHSLGEYSALYAAGVFNLETGISIVKKRGYFTYFGNDIKRISGYSVKFSYS